VKSEPSLRPAVTFASDNDLAKKTPKQKRTEMLKKIKKKHIMVKSYYKQLRRIISNDF